MTSKRNRKRKQMLSEADQESQIIVCGLRFEDVPEFFLTAGHEISVEEAWRRIKALDCRGSH